MPESPEVETFRRYCEGGATGQKVVGITINGSQVLSVEKSPFTWMLMGRVLLEPKG